MSVVLATQIVFVHLNNISVKIENVFGQIVQCISRDNKIYLQLFVQACGSLAALFGVSMMWRQAVVVHIAQSICINCQMYLSTFFNIFIEMAKYICIFLCQLAAPWQPFLWFPWCDGRVAWREMHKHERCRITLQPAVQKSPVFTLLPVLVMELVLALVLILVLVTNTVNASDSAGTH